MRAIGLQSDFHCAGPRSRGFLLKADEMVRQLLCAVSLICILARSLELNVSIE